MRELNLKVAHGRDWDTARGNFETAIAAAQVKFARWVRRVEWSEDRASAVLHGPGYRVVLAVDREHVRASGKVPVPPQLLEPLIRPFLAETLGGR
jgi:hypothetical protein